jgi:exosortase H (IPTLxxWG-CTERM-specific)
MPNAKPSMPEPESPPLPSAMSGTPMRMGRFLLLFAVSLAVLFGLLLAPFTEPAVRSFTRGLVTVSAALIRFFGGHAAAHGDLLENPVSKFEIQMAYGCNGAHVTILLWAALLAFPASWMQKVKGLAAGTVAIHAVNLVRFISLFYLGQYSQAWFDFAHLYLWESLMMLVTLVVFWTWAHFVRKSGSMADARAR